MRLTQFCSGTLQQPAHMRLGLMKRVHPTTAKSSRATGLACMDSNPEKFGADTRVIRTEIYNIEYTSRNVPWKRQFSTYLTGTREVLATELAIGREGRIAVVQLRLESTVLIDSHEIVDGNGTPMDADTSTTYICA